MLKSDIKKADRTTEAVEFPEVILIDNCSACNLRCSMCDHVNIRNHRRTQIMDRALYERIIDEIAEENPCARIWEIFFGDPFLCKDMAERIAYAKGKGLTDVVLNTNGCLMTPARSGAVIRAGLDAMYVGIDADTEETYDRIRIGGDFQAVIENVLTYRDLLATIGRTDQQLFVQYVVSDINKDEVEPFKAFWRANGVNVKIRPKISWAGLIDAGNLHDNAAVQRKPCYWLMRAINICADGEVALCSVDLHCRIKCGNVNEHTVKEIWQGKVDNAFVFTGFGDHHAGRNFYGGMCYFNGAA